MTNWKSWLKGLLAALIGGASNAVTAMWADPTVFNMTSAGLVALGKLAAAGAILSAFMYLKQSPVPKEVTPQV